MICLSHATIFLSAVLLGLFLSHSSPVEAAGDPMKGKALYEKHCLVCHGPQGKGDGPAGRLLKPPPPDFTSAASQKKSETELMLVVEDGKPGTAMGPWKSQLSTVELRDVMSYLMMLRK